MDHHRAASEQGEHIKHRVVARLTAAQLDIAAACNVAGCRVEALLGEGELTFEEAVGLAQLMGCSPAVFFDSEASDTLPDTPAVFRAK